MIECEETEEGVRAVDGAKRDLLVRARDWRPGGRRHPLTRPADATATGRTRALVLPATVAAVHDEAAGETHDVDGACGRLELDDGTYVLDVDASVKAYARFEGPATVVRHGERHEVEVAFPAERSVTLGFRSFVRSPNETLTVPESARGLATALTAFGAAHRTTTPDRTLRTMRRHPPTLEFGETTRVPDALAERIPETGVELVLPADYETLFVAAPLAFYLSATVRIEDGVTPHVRADGVGVRHDLTDPERQAPALLERCFWLDALVRGAGPHAVDVAERDLLADIGLDAERVYDQSVAERLRTYLATPYERIAADLPEWHLAMYVEPSVEHARSLPYLIDRLAHVYPPETTALDGEELMARSLDAFYRAQTGPVASVDTVKPRLRRGRVHGWLAEGTPIDVFKARPAAYENRLDYLDADDDALSVTVVLNDAGMAEEHACVADLYRERAADVPMEVTLRENVTRAELAAVLAEPNDFVHYIGHCEVGGLRCADGTLSASAVEESNAQTFFLNACGSYHEGLELVEKGSIAGAVTFRTVLDEQAAKVGTAFARLLVNGFSIERALRLARRRIRMGKDYAVVGDGTQVLTQSDARTPATLTVDRVDAERFAVTYESGSPWSHGATYHALAADDVAARLCGAESTVELSRADVCSLLEHVDVPTIYDGAFYWSDEVRSMLSEERPE
ncbi:hypothetical protein GCM10009037_04880 [Halarchaeum grantii]|uniref:CHAT domain-containing protein n=1 Tax=Halarchaeum grantii TaxID=1193105 RepID=A0A830ETX1_9EURY|nr:CHAT domain-containing protein [Halarchaeum grantii]GGL24412.1 hypothetical protein GCM10009037_04880 [Halarchaeum grantii]